MFFALRCLISGACAGFLSGLTGLGGGTIFVPVFFFLFGFPIKRAIGTSLMIIVFSSFSAGISHWRERRVDFRLAAYIVVTGILGAQLGAWVTGMLPEVLVKTFFVALTVFLSVNMWRGKKADDCVRDTPEYACSMWAACLVGLVGGIVSGMGGVGGAMVIVPLLHLFVGVPLHICVGTALVAVFFNALSGSVGYLMRGMVDARTAFIVACAAVVFAPLGARASMRLDQGRLRRVFAVVLMLAGAAVFLRK